MMLQMNGLEVLERIKAKKEIKVVMMTAIQLYNKSSKISQEGATNYVMKPFSSLKL